MDYTVRITKQDDGSEIRDCATRTDVENFVVEGLRQSLSEGQDILISVERNW